MADWEASDGNNTYQFSNDEFMNTVRNIREKLHSDSNFTDQQYMQFLNELLGIGGKPGEQAGPHGHRINQQPFGAKKAPKWNSVAEMLADLKSVHQQIKPAKPYKNPEVRIKEIEHELDILRGRVPTPKGYTVTPKRVKQLMTEYKQLKQL